MIRRLVAICPFTFLGLFIGGKPITAALVLCVLIAANEILGPPPDDDDHAVLRWRRPFLLLVLVGLVSLARSPFGSVALQKGLVQAVGMLAVIFTASAVVKLLRDEPEAMIELVRDACLATAVLAGVAIVQSICWNFRLVPGLSFSFLNDLAGGEVWRDPGTIGPIFRANSLCREPAHLCLLLGMGAGVAAIRLGFAGARHKDAIATVLSTRTALVILTGYIVSLSILGFVQLLVMVGAAWIVSHRIAIRSLVALVFRLGVVLIVIVAMARQAGSLFFEKLGTLQFIIDPELGSLESDVSQSALTIATHLDVLSQVLPDHPLLGIGLGAHPVAYERYAPEWSRAIEGVWEVNADDGASLLLRLLSETGLLGAIAFLVGVGAVFHRARRAILEALDRLAGRAPPTLLSICIGMTASMAAVTLICLARYPAYYEPIVWMLLAFTAAVPWVLRGSALTEEPAGGELGHGDAVA